MEPEALEKFAIHKHIFEMAIQSISILYIPTYREDDKVAVRRAFSWAFQLDHDQYEAWLSWFMTSVFVQSLGEVVLSKGNFHTGVKGISQALCIKAKGNEYKIVLGPYDPPFSHATIF